MRAEDRHLGAIQKNETVLYWDPKRLITACSPLANLAPVKSEARNKTDPIYVLLAEASKTKTHSELTCNNTDCGQEQKQQLERAEVYRSPKCPKIKSELV